MRCPLQRYTLELDLVCRQLNFDIEKSYELKYSKPSISVVVPTRNRPDKLKYCIASLTNLMEHLNVQVIIASNGDSLEYDLSELAIRDIEVVRSEHRLSMARNWAFGLSFASQEWAAFIGDDDLVLPGAGERLAEVLRQATCSAVKFNSVTFNWNKNGSLDPLTKLLAVASQDVNPEHIISKPKNLWWREQPRNYPCGQITSPIRTELLQSWSNKKWILNGLSPDWGIGAQYLSQQLCFQRFELSLVASGISDVSSVSLIKANRRHHSESRSILIAELNLLESNTMHPRIKLAVPDFPTTWLSKIDSLLWARSKIGKSTFVPYHFLIWDSLQTTPRFVLRAFLSHLSSNKSKVLSLILILPLTMSASLLKWIRRTNIKNSFPQRFFKVRRRKNASFS